jgi:hypothetical protein
MAGERSHEVEATLGPFNLEYATETMWEYKVKVTSLCLTKYHAMKI